MLVFVVNGNRFSNVDEAGVTVQVTGFKPANCALRGLIFAGTHRLAGVHHAELIRGILAQHSSRRPPGSCPRRGSVSVVRKPS